MDPAAGAATGVPLARLTLLPWDHAQEERHLQIIR